MRRAKKIVLVTHHLHEVLPEIDWFVFLKSGELVAQGERKELLTDKKISNLFEIPINIEQKNGRFTANVTSA